MKKPSKPYKMIVLELDKREGLLDDESAETLKALQKEYEEDLSEYYDRELDAYKEAK
jgi:hypothetical protein